MRVYLLRHGQTQDNAEHRYQGQRDVPLSPAGLSALRRADFAPETVYVTPLRRTRQTAAVLFPDAVQIPVPDLSEIRFGRFEGRSFSELEHDPAYRAWVDSGCTVRIPGGESRAEFCARVCAAFAGVMEQALTQPDKPLVIVAHGGTQMAVLERFAVPSRDYYSWQSPTGGGFVLQTSRSAWRDEQILEFLDTVQYTKEST